MLKACIKLDIQWIPQTENQKPIISGLIDIDDWQLPTEFFLELDNSWGPHVVDCMATYYSTKISRFFSRFWNPGSVGIKVFVHPLADENCLVVPPVSLVLHYLCVHKAKAMLVVPFWPVMALHQITL